VRRRQNFVTIIVGNNSLLREGLATILRSANFRILASVSTTDDVVPRNLGSHALFLFVQSRSNFETVLEQVEHVRKHHPCARIVIVADRCRLAEPVVAFRAGANGYFVDIPSCDVFIRSLELVTLGQRADAFLSFVLGPEGAQLGEQPAKNQAVPSAPAGDIIGPQLSNREKSILRCLVEGHSNKSIARKFDIAEATVKVHVKAILRKVHVQNRTQAAVWGMNNESLTGRANSSSPSSTAQLSSPPANTGGLFSEIREIGAPVPLALIDQQQDSVNLPQVDHLIGRDPYRGTHNGVRHGR